MKCKKFSLLHIILISLFFNNSLPKANLNQKEKDFILQHHASIEETEKLDVIFCTLDPVLFDLMAGKIVDNTRENIKELFEQAGFKVHNLRLQIIQPGTDKWPARAVLTHVEIPEYFIKIGFDIFFPRKNISRIIRADIINAIIENPAYDITTIDKIEKKLYKRLKSSDSLNKNTEAINDDQEKQDPLNDYFYLVLSPKIEGTQADKSEEGWLTFRNYTDKHYKDFTKLMDLIGYEDPSPENIIFTPEGKIAIIDTEILHPDLLEKYLKEFLDE